MKKTALTALFGMALLSGCASDVVEWTPAEAPKKNQVQRTTAEHVVRYPAHLSTIPHAEKHRLEAFINDQLRYPNAVHIYVTEFGGHGEARLKDLLKRIRKAGVRQNGITVDHYHDEDLGYTGSGVLLMVERYIVVPPSCPDWTRSLSSVQGAESMPNYGCADTANLGMMIADPRDLIQGKDVGLYDGTRHALSVEMYRKDEVKELITENTSNLGSSAGGGGA